MIEEVVIPTVELLGYILSRVVIVQFILSLLITYNVVNFSNKFVSSVWQALNAILDPILNPIRKRMPETGGIDFSPMVLLFAIQVTIYLLQFLGHRIEGPA